MDNNKPDGWDWAKLLSETGMIIGGALVGHHRAAYDRWWDKKLACHGKIGTGLFFVSLICRLACEFLEPPRCSKCHSRLTYVSQCQRHYCENCLEYV